jgi:hypothetical protein
MPLLRGRGHPASGFLINPTPALLKMKFLDHIKGKVGVTDFLQHNIH